MLRFYSCCIKPGSMVLNNRIPKVLNPILNTIVYFSLFSWWDRCRTAFRYKSDEGIDEHHVLWKITQTHGLATDEFLVRGNKMEEFSIKQRSRGKPWRPRECETTIFPVIYIKYRLDEANVKGKWELLNLIKNSVPSFYGWLYTYIKKIPSTVPV